MLARPAANCEPFQVVEPLGLAVVLPPEYADARVPGVRHLASAADTAYWMMRRCPLMTRQARVTGQLAHHPRDLRDFRAEVRGLSLGFACISQRLCLRRPRFSSRVDGRGACSTCGGAQARSTGDTSAASVTRLLQLPTPLRRASPGV